MRARSLAWSPSLSLALALAGAGTATAAGRTTISLDGTWDIEDSKAPDAMPAAWHHTAPVPGLAHSAQPAFAKVDEFASRQYILNLVDNKKLPRSAIVQTAGVSHQDRDWFWYHRTFDVAAPGSVAILRIAKAQFGATVWLNGQKVGEHLPCFTAVVVDVGKALRPGRNELVIRIGAHPGVLPPEVSAGTDFEKLRWTPGIYDSVSLALSDNPAIESIQVAPRIADSSIAIQTALHNLGASPVTFDLGQRVHAWKQAAVTAAAAPQRITLRPGEARVVTQRLALPGARLWSPEAPNLYMLETTTGGDSASTRFGMRELSFDTATRRAYLNNQVYFLRGSNIALHRFFEDPLSGTLPWDEAWVRKLLVDLPHQLHWNAFRFSIGPVPDRWLEIADEAGLLIQNEYFVWTGAGWHGKDNQVHPNADQLIREYIEWMRDNWNHPSVVIWDANNETWEPPFTDQIIPAVRGLDLSNRAWENSYNAPAGPEDPVEDHPYEFQAMADGGPAWSMTTLENANGAAPVAASGHALLLNEYGWLWLNRDGTPTELTKKLYPRLLGKAATAADRLELDAYLLAGLTEFWRAYRHYAGVLHFVYLTACDPKGYTCDHFRDVTKLELQPAFIDYMANAFAPLGVYLSFWHPTLVAGEHQDLRVMMVNDVAAPAHGTLTIELASATGDPVELASTQFALSALGQQTFNFDVTVPATKGKVVLQAVAQPTGGSRTVSRRKLEIVGKARGAKE